ncbi:MAG: hypothetical protein IPO21_02940 [Bacteroidales bacterium]|nr:hypothetical protein [Bacteroidales bacterium]
MEKGFETTDTWVLFGDPTLQLITDTLSNIEFTTASSTTLGTNYLEIETSLEDAVICITQNDSILVASHIYKGNNKLEFNKIGYSDTLLITATAKNKTVLIKKIAVNEGNTPFVNIQECTFTNEVKNTHITYNDTIYNSLQIKNTSNKDLSNVTIKK